MPRSDLREDDRVHARRHIGTFDLILSRSANTFAALSSGAFALAENYLFTVEAMQDFYRALAEDGILLVRAPGVHAAADQRGAGGVALGPVGSGATATGAGF